MLAEMVPAVTVTPAVSPSSVGFPCLARVLANAPPATPRTVPGARVAFCRRKDALGVKERGGGRWWARLDRPAGRPVAGLLVFSCRPFSEERG